jgi:hypothetical protein
MTAVSPVSIQSVRHSNSSSILNSFMNEIRCPDRSKIVDFDTQSHLPGKLATTQSNLLLNKPFKRSTESVPRMG